MGQCLGSARETNAPLVHGQAGGAQFDTVFVYQMFGIARAENFSHFDWTRFSIFLTLPHEARASYEPTSVWQRARVYAFVKRGQSSQESVCVSAAWNRQHVAEMLWPAACGTRAYQSGVLYPFEGAVIAIEYK